VSQRRLADFVDEGDSFQCPICTDTEPTEDGYKNSELLEHLYLTHDLQDTEVAELYDRSRSTIKNWLRRYDISKPRFQYEIPEEELRQLYLEEQKAISEIADQFGCSYLAVHNRLEIHDIPIRSSAETLGNPDDNSYRDEAWLRERYHEDGLSKAAIAQECGVAESTIQYWMDSFEIEARNLDDAQHQRYARQERAHRDEETLRTLYWADGLTQREIADRLGVSQLAVQTWMDNHDIQLRYTGAHGQTYETERGEHVRSSHERRIADWLYTRGVDYEYEPDAEEIELRPDFRIQGDFVEYWGMLNREEYVERMHEKLTRYADADITLINLFPHHLGDLGQKLGQYV